MYKINIVFVALSILALSISGAACFVDFLDSGKMSQKQDQPDWRVEGYWKTDISQESAYPFPIANTEEWPLKKSFAEQLARVENALEKHNFVMYFRGLAPSRLEANVFVGSCEFSDPFAKIAWPCGYREHYIEKHNIIPSIEFFQYVMDFDVSNWVPNL